MTSPIRRVDETEYVPHLITSSLLPSSVTNLSLEEFRTSRFSDVIENAVTWLWRFRNLLAHVQNSTDESMTFFVYVVIAHKHLCPKESWKIWLKNKRTGTVVSFAGDLWFIVFSFLKNFTVARKRKCEFHLSFSAFSVLLFPLEFSGNQNISYLVFIFPDSATEIFGCKSFANDVTFPPWKSMI